MTTSKTLEMVANLISRTLFTPVIVTSAEFEPQGEGRMVFKVVGCDERMQPIILTGLVDEGTERSLDSSSELSVFSDAGLFCIQGEHAAQDRDDFLAWWREAFAATARRVADLQPEKLGDEWFE